MSLFSKTRVVTLDKGTIEANKRFFDDDIDRVPKKAISIGMQEILGSDRIIIMANDVSKKESIKELFSSNISYNVPASFLK